MRVQGKGMVKTYWLEGKVEVDDGPIDVHSKTRNPSTVNLHNFSMDDALGTGHASVRSTQSEKHTDDKVAMLASERKAVSGAGSGTKVREKEGGRSHHQHQPPTKPDEPPPEPQETQLEQVEPRRHYFEPTVGESAGLY